MITNDVMYNADINGRTFDVCSCRRCGGKPTMRSIDHHLYGTRESYYKTDYHLECYTCNSKGRSADSKYDAIAVWNRTQTPMSNAMKALYITVATVLFSVFFMIAVWHH